MAEAGTSLLEVCSFLDSGRLPVEGTCLFVYGAQAASGQWRPQPAGPITAQQVRGTATSSYIAALGKEVQLLAS